jgi:hypothetical protein
MRKLKQIIQLFYYNMCLLDVEKQINKPEFLILKRYFKLKIYKIENGK